MSDAQRANVELVEKVARMTESEGPIGLLEIFEDVFHPESKAEATEAAMALSDA